MIWLTCWGFQPQAGWIQGEQHSGGSDVGELLGHGFGGRERSEGEGRRCTPQGQVPGNPTLLRPCLPAARSVRKELTIKGVNCRAQSSVTGPFRRSHLWTQQIWGAICDLNLGLPLSGLCAVEAGSRGRGLGLPPEANPTLREGSIQPSPATIVL